MSLTRETLYMQSNKETKNKLTESTVTFIRKADYVQMNQRDVSDHASEAEGETLTGGSKITLTKSKKFQLEYLQQPTARFMTL